MSTVSESLSILAQVDIALAWKSQAAISLLVHRVRGLDAQLLPQVWFPISPINVTGAVLDDCLRTLYTASDEELMPFRATMEYSIFTRFRVLPYVHSLLPNEDLPCHTYLTNVAENLAYRLYFYSSIWTRSLVQLSRAQNNGAPLLGSRNLSPEDCFRLVIISRRHALRYVQLFPDAPLIPESSDRRHTHVNAKLLAIERGLDCPGISLIMFLDVRELLDMRARDIYQMIQLLGLFGRFPEVTKAACGLSSDLHIYQKDYDLKI
ncbi:hypothetical protein TSTA_081830 [Talaromyces stipitatus ATCC 10500]|uniref:Uncharacterized protein n=1 Tax=Talaromyces stipitatus (strain ATCC 10500 / CBS 375.48 / QM 6759 / NRRL 1006) TaxID=441959 RepID=B8M018_TALSN|nr:uncharacterized protein TSTA_081830 [Talaromyces stipitatus ATCC 10500]EED20950.1 hypothetical protein TSTA_081830 [Talaromyces stipitatus ATCC 10500]